MSQESIFILSIRSVISRDILFKSLVMDSSTSR